MSGEKRNLPSLEAIGIDVAGAREARRRESVFAAVDNAEEPKPTADKAPMSADEKRTERIMQAAFGRSSFSAILDRVGASLGVAFGAVFGMALGPVFAIMGASAIGYSLYGLAFLEAATLTPLIVPLIIGGIIAGGIIGAWMVWTQTPHG